MTSFEHATRATRWVVERSRAFSANERAVTIVSALLTGLVAYACISAAPRFPNQDAIHYLSLAEHLARGDGYRSSLHFFDDRLQPPLYPLLVSVGIRLGASSLSSAVAVCVLAQALTTVALLRLHAALVGNDGTRLFCAAIAIASPNLAIGVQLTLEPIFLCGIAWSACLVLTGLERGGSRYAAAGGACLGLTVLARSEAVVTAAILALILVALAALRRERVHLVQLAALLLACALVVLPYGLWMKSELGYFEVLPKVRYNLPLAEILNGMAWSPDEVSVPDRLERILFSLMPDHATFVLDYAFRHPAFDATSMFPRTTGPATGESLHSLGRSIRSVIGESVFGMGLFQPMSALLMGVSAWVALKRAALSPQQRLLTLCLFALVGANLVPAVASGEDLSRRFLAAPLMFSVPLVSAGAARLVSSKRWRHDAAQTAVAFALGLALVLTNARLTRKIVGGLGRDHARTDAVEKVCESVLPQGARVLSDVSRYAFLRHGYAFQLPYVRTWDELAGHIAHYRIEYAIIDSHALKQKPSRIVREGLVDPGQWPAGWQTVAQLFSDGEPIWIVRLPPSSADP